MHAAMVKSKSVSGNGLIDGLEKQLWAAVFLTSYEHALREVYIVGEATPEQIANASADDALESFRKAFPQ
jgi:hypothetical protein